MTPSPPPSITCCRLFISIVTLEHEKRDAIICIELNDHSIFSSPPPPVLFHLPSRLYLSFGKRYDNRVVWRIM